MKKKETELVIPGVLALLQPEKGICSGDSGGPLFVVNEQGQRTLLGVSVAGNNFQNILQPCHGFSLFTDLRPQLSWIQATLQELKNADLK